MRKITTILFAGLFVAGCSTGTDDFARASFALSGGNSAVSGTSTSPSHKKSLDFQEIVVTVRKVTVHSNTAGWVTVRDEPLVVDLLDLERRTADLGIATLPEGKITQIRLYVDDQPAAYVTTDKGEQAPLIVPSGEQSGIKLKGLWGVSDCEDSSFTVEFKGRKSIWVHGRGNHTDYIMRPVIHTYRGSSVNRAGCDPNDGDNPGDDPTDFPGSDPEYPGGDDPGGFNGDPSFPGGGDDPSSDPSDDPSGHGYPYFPYEPVDPADGDGGGTTDPTDPSGGGDSTPDPNDPANGSGYPGTGTPCGMHSECGSSGFCDAAGACAPRYDSGAACEIDDECASNICASGICGGFY